MLYKITRGEDLDKRKLMDIYAESNAENAEDFFPEETDRKEALRKAEAGFLDFLKNDFLAGPGNACWVLEENGIWCSALRTSQIRPGLYYLEALETRPDRRKNGCASRLLSGVLDSLKEDGSFRLCACVSKKNTASLKTHEKCGFRIVSDKGYDYLNEEADEWDYGLEYDY